MRVGLEPDHHPKRGKNDGKRQHHANQRGGNRQFDDHHAIQRSDQQNKRHADGDLEKGKSEKPR